MRKRKYESSDPRQKKTWEIEQQGTSLITSFAAKSGAAPRVVTHEHGSEEEAGARFDKLVREHEEQGYRLVDAEDHRARAPGHENDAIALQNAIAAAPDDADAYLVYGDWLSSHGDPHGELIAVQTALTDKPRDGVLRAKQRELLDRHADAWLGALAGEDGFDAEWRWGFLEAVELGVDEPCGRDTIDALRLLFRLPTARFLRDLTLGDFGHRDEVDLADVVSSLTKAPPPKTLRRLVIDPKRARLRDIAMGDISAMLAQMRQLEDLSLRAADVTLGKLNLPELVRFKLITRATKPVVRAVASARWPKLSHLVLGFGKADGGSTPADVAPILEGANTPALTHLGLRSLPFADEVVTMLRQAKVLPRLRSLDLSKGRLSRGGAEAFLGMAKALAHLEDIDLSGTVLPREVVMALTAKFGDRLTVDAGTDESVVDDDDEDGEERYDEITE